MNFRRGDIAVALTAIAGAVALFLPLGAAGGWPRQDMLLWIAALIVAILPALDYLAGPASSLLALLGAIMGGAALYGLVDAGARGIHAPGLWLGIIVLAILAWRAMAAAASLAVAYKSNLLHLAAPILLGVWAIFMWQVLTVGFDIPRVLLPPPSDIAVAMVGSAHDLMLDFVQTFIRAMIPGYLIGCGAGFIVGVLVDRVPFLQRGLLPLGNLVSALPVVAVAPIMVMWFGFDWQSKAAVVVIMTFFPMLVSTIAGLAALSRIELDLMRTYAASYGQTLWKARLQAAMPFIFNALKINSTLALIGAIVAEFFGTPVVGMGFRISTEVGRMNISMVWATIVVAAVTGSAAYGGLALMERIVTFWHPSLRKVAS
ncbi:MAG TPA: ABC transporter permease [Stellaceae bacterium]|nr:ABC transporter permease [Stellaceae bacterium]